MARHPRSPRDLGLVFASGGHEGTNKSVAVAYLNASKSETLPLPCHGDITESYGQVDKACARQATQVRHKTSRAPVAEIYVEPIFRYHVVVANVPTHTLLPSPCSSPPTINHVLLLGPSQHTVSKPNVYLRLLHTESAARSLYHVLSLHQVST